MRSNIRRQADASDIASCALGKEIASRLPLHLAIMRLIGDEAFNSL
jgi:hypothetical protein